MRLQVQSRPSQAKQQTMEKARPEVDQEMVQGQVWQRFRAKPHNSAQYPAIRPDLMMESLSNPHGLRLKEKRPLHPYPVPVLLRIEERVPSCSLSQSTLRPPLVPSLHLLHLTFPPRQAPTPTSTLSHQAQEKIASRRGQTAQSLPLVPSRPQRHI